jgi:bidirectional [NiFe] hydrogenase diaphorase subunit
MAHVSTRPKTTSHPSGDKRFKLLEVTMKRHQFRTDSLIEVLHASQELFGFLEQDLLFFISRHLKRRRSKVFGVATFQKFFGLRPNGERSCVICSGTAGNVKGADTFLKAIQRMARNEACETIENGSGVTASNAERDS